MKPKAIIQELDRNADIIEALLTGVPEAAIRWKPQPDEWCLLEIVCHLYDEEREDFRARVGHVLETPGQPMPSIDPVGWVTERSYLEQDYRTKVVQFIGARHESIEWLWSLEDPHWDNTYDHPKLGRLTAGFFLSNWLAHDYLHIRQINRNLYGFLSAELTREKLDYAGNW